MNSFGKINKDFESNLEFKNYLVYYSLSISKWPPVSIIHIQEESPFCAENEALKYFKEHLRDYNPIILKIEELPNELYK